jgi:RNA polymerase sigma factor (sigma-70 family)
MSPVGFKSLLERAIRGDQDAWRAVIESVQPILVRRAIRLLGPNALNNSGNDLLQDAWERAYRKIGSLHLAADDDLTARKFLKWMGRLLVRVHLNRERRKQTKRRRPPLPVVSLDPAGSTTSTVTPSNGHPAAQDTSVSKRLQREERRRLVLQALDTLEPSARQVVEMRMLIDTPLTFRAIAERMNFTEWQVRQIFKSCLDRLRVHLKPSQD